MATFLGREACPNVKNILLLDSEGRRVAAKYYSDEWPTNTTKLAFEKSIFTKTQKTHARSEGKLPSLEELEIWKFEKLQFVGREFLGITSSYINAVFDGIEYHRLQKLDDATTSPAS